MFKFDFEMINQISPSNELARPTANIGGTVYGQIHEHINFIKKFKLNTELTTKEKVEIYHNSSLKIFF